MEEKHFATNTLVSKHEKEMRTEFQRLFTQCPIPEEEILSNLSLFLKRQDISKILFIDSLYRLSKDTHGSIFEFGTRWGKNFSLMMSLRGIYEPYNSTRKIVGFDSFAGFPSVHLKDGQDESISKGNFTVTKNYSEYLKKVLAYQASESPLSHVLRHEVVEGSIEETFPKYLDENPETIISLVYFDLDIYSPTKTCLELIKPYLTKGSVIGFDELNVHAMPGETIALREVFGLGSVKIQRNKFSSAQAYVVVE